MTLEVFRSSLSQSHPPEGVSKLLQALWHDGKNDWHAAHNVTQDIGSPEASWIHAYLHRKEGDSGNASYWYHKAGRSMPDISLKEEWELITKEVLEAESLKQKA